MAQVIKRNNSYQIVVSLGYDDNGKQIRKTTTYKIPEGVTARKAQKLVNEYAYEFEKKCKNMFDLDENLKFSELVDKYLEVCAPNKLKEGTLYNYKKNLNKHILPYIGNMRLKVITPSVLTDMIAKWDVQPSTAKRILFKVFLDMH